jgi:hypothetical protein
MNKNFALVSIVALSLQLPIAGSAQTANVQQIAQANTDNDYFNRGNAKYQAGDKQGAIFDFQQAAKLYRSQSNNTNLQIILDLLNKLGATE